MNFNKAANVVWVFLAAGILLISSGCSSGESSAPSTASTPTDAYKKLFAAVKSGNTDQIKKSMSRASLSFGESISAQQGKTIEELLKNGFTRTTMSESLPQIRDERIKDSYGAVEVFSQKDGKWEDLPFILEDGEWKLAVGDLFNGSWKRPGVSKSVREQMEANTAAPANGVPYGNSINNANLNAEEIVPIVPKRVPNPDLPSADEKRR